MNDRLPIPADLWTRILAFIDGQRTGQISLNINQGTVCTIEIRERIRREPRSA